jgi:hypothetical protein
MTLDKLVNLAFFDILGLRVWSFRAYQFDDKRGRILQGDCGVEVESINGRIHEIQTCDIECAL